MWSDVVEAETIRVPVVPGMVAVIGLGRIGLPMAVQYAARGWRVVACDANERVGENIKSELRSLYEEPALKSELSGLIERGLLSATTNTAEAGARANVVIVVGLLQFDEQNQGRFQELE